MSDEHKHINLKAYASYHYGQGYEHGRSSMLKEGIAIILLVGFFAWILFL